jgi:hypothetical protein
MEEVVFMVEPETRGGHRWHIKRGGSIRATYTSRAQAVIDATQLASFEHELRGQTAIVRVLDEERAVTEDVVCDFARHVPSVVAVPASRGGTKVMMR